MSISWGKEAAQSWGLSRWSAGMAWSTGHGELGHILRPLGHQCWHLHNPRGAGIRLLGNICCFCRLFPWMCSRISRPLDRPLAAMPFLQILETQCGTNHDLSCGIFLGKPLLPVRNPCGKKKPEIQKDFGWPLLSHN